ncbi:flavodoxin family protein, partial [Acinetobacter baumannii]|nr:flavodoxin family protein [Acinetobacter baumannii]
TTARLCNLALLAPVYTCGISYADRDADKIAQQKTLAREHAARLIARLNTLVE